MAAGSVIEEFDLPVDLEASAPPETRGLARDDVRLLVSNLSTDRIEHAHFRDLPRWLSPGDVLVVNTSATIPAALAAADHTGREVEIHLSTQLPGGFWTVEVRLPAAVGSLPCHDFVAGAVFQLPGDGEITLLAPYPYPSSMAASSMSGGSRLWIAAVAVQGGILEYLDRFGEPIRYGYAAARWPMPMYQTVFANEPGSAEMPSAARPFTTDLVTTLVTRGVQIAPLLLHTGVASLEDHEPPYEEFYRVSRDTADRVNAARRAGHRIVAVGTTVVRALETVTDERGDTSPGEGWTSRLVDASRPVRSVNGLITGFHEPRATHLMMLEQIVRAIEHPRDSTTGSALQRAYDAARSAGYLWHEFGDSHLIIGASAER